MTEIKKIKKGTKANGKGPGGRPFGAVTKPKSLNQQETELMKRAIVSRIATQAHKLVDMQLSLASGCMQLFRIDKDEKGRDTKPVLVKDEEEIRMYLEGEKPFGCESSYYYFTTEKPDLRAIENLLDRAFGAPAVTSKISGPDDGPVAFTFTDDANARRAKYVKNTIIRPVGQ